MSPLLFPACPGMYLLWYSASLRKPPERVQDMSLVSHWEKLLSQADAKKEMTLGFWTGGERRKPLGSGEKIRTHCIVTPWTSPSYPCTQIQSLWPQSLGRLFSIPNLFFFLPACHSLCWKIRLSLQLGIKAQSSALAVAWEVAFPGFWLIRRDTAFPFRWGKNCCYCCFFCPGGRTYCAFSS